MYIFSPFISKWLYSLNLELKCMSLNNYVLFTNNKIDIKSRAPVGKLAVRLIMSTPVGHIHINVHVVPHIQINVHAGPRK